MSNDEIDPLDIAVIGMAGRFPGASSVGAFWENLQAGVESLKRLSEADLRAAGVDPAISSQPNYVPVSGNLDRIDGFDAGFFGYSPREAEVLDPQSRLFLECAWEALESAGWAGQRGDARVGVFASSAISGYLLLHLAPSLDLANAMMPVDFVRAHTANDKDFIATRVSYKLNLHGPAVTVQTACSSSLVAIHVARQSLLTQECDIAIAGGVALHLPQGIGYVYDEDYVLSADGHTRTFDAKASGTVFGDGAGAVVLKRLEDAIRDRDPILAVIKGSAINNDGDRKVGYTAPSQTGLMEVVTEALGNAGVDADTIGYIEAHGTATPQGDPIEIAALNHAFRSQTEGVGFCGIGSVKTNIGHLENAAGVAGFIKAVLMVKEGWLVPSLHYESPNPRAPLADSPFFVTTARRPWRSAGPRRAGINSLGIGGTNAHVIVQEPPRPAKPAAETEPRPQLLCLSAKTPAALRELASRYESFLGTTKEPWADICFTSQRRRAHFAERFTVVGASSEAVRAGLASFAASGAADGRARAARGTARAEAGSVVFVFSGQGGQWIGMGRDLLRTDPVFREALERIDRVIRTLADWSVLDVVEGRGPAASLDRIDIIQPMVFALQVALAERLRAWGIVPRAVIGHSMGEVAAAHVAGALSLEDAARVICTRSRLIFDTALGGAMALVELSEAEARAAVEGIADVSVAAVNGPRNAVLSGARVALEPIFQRLEQRGVFCRWIAVDRASHSPIMDPILPELGEKLASLRPQAASIAFYSTVTAEPASGAELDGRYWVRNLRLPVRFWATVERLIRDGHSTFVELNGHPLLLPAISNLDTDETGGVPLSLVSTLRRDSDSAADLLHAVGQLHNAGYPIDFARIAPEERQAVTLPTYAFQRQRCWIDPPTFTRVAHAPAAVSCDDWFHEVSWRPAPSASPSSQEPGSWLVLADRGGVGGAMADELVRRGARVEVLFAAEITLDLENPEAVATEIRSRIEGKSVRGVVHLWSLDVPPTSELDELHAGHARAVGTALGTIQALGDSDTALWLVTRGAQAVGTNAVALGQAPLWGLGRAIAVEQAERRVALVDLDPNADDTARLVDDLLSDTTESQIAYRNAERRIARLARVQVGAPVDAGVRADGTYLVTGGLNGVGLGTGRWLAGRGARHLVLCGRSAPNEAALAAIKELESAGVIVKVASCDVANRAAVTALLTEIDATMPPLRGVFHSAVVVDDAVLERQDWSRFRRVFAPKVDGAWNLHLATQGRALDYFVVYSSIAALIPPVGSANYAAANAFVDALAVHRRSLGLPATTINWGAWGNLGIAASRGMLETFEENGVLTMEPDLAFEAMRRVLATGPAHVLVARLDGNRVAQDSVFASELATAGEEDRDSGVDAAEQARATILAVTGAERAARVTAWLQQCVATILRIAPDTLAPDAPLSSFNMDSLMAVELRNRAKNELGVAIKLGEVFHGSTLQTLCERILPQLANATAVVPTTPKTPKPVSATKPKTLVAKPAVPPAVTPRPAETIERSERAADGWLVVQRPNPRAEMRLVCFPYAGGGTAVFAGWSADLPPWLEVSAVELPARGNRLNEAPVDSFDEIVNALVPALARFLDDKKPFAMFGHCLGSMIMNAVVQRLEAEYGLRPLQLFVAAAGSPDIYMAVDTSAVASDAVLDLLNEINFANAKVLLEDEEARNLLLPGVLADFRIAARYRYKPGKRYDQPITTFAGFDDVFTPPKQMDGWRDFTTGAFSSFIYAGGHYFIEKERPSVLRIVSQELMVHHARMRQRDPAKSLVRPSGRTTPSAATTSRLFCVGYAGGSARTFATWQEHLPGVDVVALELPGRGVRADEPPLHRVEDIVAELLRAITPHLDQPYALVGHDLGALVVYELSRAIVAAGHRPPTHLFLSSEQAPHRRRPASLQYLDDALFASTLVGYKFPRRPQDWGRADWDVLRADFAARSEYARPFGDPIDIPIHVIEADRDMMVQPAAVESWADVSRAKVTLHQCPGTHYYIDDPHPFVVDVIAKTVRGS